VLFKGILRTFLAAALLTGAAAGLSAQISGDAWDNFAAWYVAYTGPMDMQQVLRAYSAKLAAGGATDAEIKAVLEQIQKTAAASPVKVMALRFDNVYASRPELFESAANALLVRTVKELKPGKALDVAMGQGRNAVFLAKLGWDVTGYDVSEGAIAAAQANARNAGVGIHALKATHDSFEFGREQWDLIVMTYTLVDMNDTVLLRRIRDSLKPGGRIVLEQMNSGGTGKGPANALFKSFEDLRVIYYEDAVDRAEWGRAPMRIGRVVAEKD
jgi:SAM-dependent methyltransferase